MLAGWARSERPKLARRARPGHCGSLALLAHGGREALTRRAAAAAAGVQAPTIYRLFGDKQGLVDAVAEHDLRTYLRQKRTDGPSDDPVEDLRLGWDVHLGFGLDRWRKRVGVEPTKNRLAALPGFEVRTSHRGAFLFRKPGRELDYSAASCFDRPKRLTM